ncbi:Dolichyl-phosphate-mannose-protein mannosyltransferase-domain-containing protein [Fimicolochytrium jonesii]|uniref:Dolichyl-phosphate-mannose-protein mannosyltransferase-domain-containing protein n=1 Tax=Fimicolochytrium jonesii TaxID=1396493 RepID=UPI0022FE9766|nr:Dolichyl-phosphate-mannose-protein mannosyltransferase-domain-containing protein [Fimicolochytrium jonesii]KAI8818426.1 Dolichyl-phosphate-mannose-protein mannosyltransferase-domain-containing protein [Fimicolochytrium jonesii]
MGVMVTLTLIGVLVRLFRLSNPSQVVFDEVHFGGFASKYISGKFFMDVHPPLGKLLIAASGVMAGFDGSFDFKEIGMDYIAPRVPYVSMRLLPGIMGVLMVPMAYATMRNLSVSHPIAVMTALLVVFENALTCQSRLILLDSILLFFTAWAVQAWTDFQASMSISPFSLRWWTSLFLTGLGIGLAASVKWVGLFVIAWVGFSTVYYLWELLADLTVTPTQYAKRFSALALCLIAVPIAVYLLIFQLHFLALPNTGSGAGFMSPEFQSTLRGTEIKETYEEIGLGATVLIRHEGTSGGYIHSHPAKYPTGSKQQQVTLYPYGDENSWFKVEPALEYDNGTAFAPDVKTFERVKHGDSVRLLHVKTGMRMHSHDHRPPVTDTEGQQEVSAYGAVGFIGDSNDHWRVEVLGAEKMEQPVYLKALTHKFRLIHVNTGCALFSHKVKLPEWAYGQQEVTCAKNGKKSFTTWRIESNTNDLQPPTSLKTRYQAPGFFAKFVEAHRMMWKINSGLDASHPFQSRPDSWPGMKRGISFWTAKDGGSAQMHLVGNPVVWSLAGAALVGFLVLQAVEVVSEKRQWRRFAGMYFISEATGPGTALIFTGWLLHYLPFFLMTRQLFLHHYLPSLYFSILLFGTFTEGLTTAFSTLLASRWNALVTTWPGQYRLPLWFRNWARGQQSLPPKTPTHKIRKRTASEEGLHHRPYEPVPVQQPPVITPPTELSARIASDPRVLALKCVVALAVVVVTIAVFVAFSPLTYGLPMSKERCEGLKWRTEWNWGCKDV